MDPKDQKSIYDEKQNPSNRPTMTIVELFERENDEESESEEEEEEDSSSFFAKL